MKHPDDLNGCLEEFEWNLDQREDLEDFEIAQQMQARGCELVGLEYVTPDWLKGGADFGRIALIGHQEIGGYKDIPVWERSEPLPIARVVQS